MKKNPEPASDNAERRALQVVSAIASARAAEHRRENVMISRARATAGCCNHLVEAVRENLLAERTIPREVSVTPSCIAEMKRGGVDGDAQHALGTPVPSRFEIPDRVRPRGDEADSETREKRVEKGKSGPQEPAARGKGSSVVCSDRES